MADDTNAAPNVFCWHEVVTTDPEKAKRFYTSLLGWTTSEMDMGDAGKYTMFHAAGVPVAGIEPMTGEQREGTPPHWGHLYPGARRRRSNFQGQRSWCEGPCRADGHPRCRPVQHHPGPDRRRDLSVPVQGQITRGSDWSKQRRTSSLRARQRIPAAVVDELGATGHVHSAFDAHSKSAGQGDSLRRTEDEKPVRSCWYSWRS